jgi:putative inorganic carbon (HCO3(-)) transporter
MAAAFAAAQVHYPGAAEAFRGLAILALLGAMAYLALTVRPVYLLCAALFLSPIAGNWQALGIPGFAAPDRLLLVAFAGAVLLRSPGTGDRPQFRVAPVHWLMIATITYAAGSAVATGTLVERSPFFQLFDAFGVMPYLIFALAPLALTTERDRDALLGTFVALGAWLGLTTLFETIRLDALVFPQYILDPSYGIHVGRGRGPFVEAVTNGFALYVCAVASVLAWRKWREQTVGLIALAVGVLCAAGTVMCLQRSVWLGAVVATIIVLVVFGEMRRYAPLILVVLVAVVLGSLSAIPGLSDRVAERVGKKESLWDRQNLVRAGFNMVEARPLFGFGWEQFRRQNLDYFEQADDYPLRRVINLDLHNAPLTYAVELGLLGATLWLLTIAAGVGGALVTRGPPDLHSWRILLLATAVCYAIIINFVPPSFFPNLAIWLIAGVVWSGRYAKRPSQSSAV